MDILTSGPAVLGGIMLSVALAAWTLGRWQGGLELPDDHAAHPPGAPEESRAMSAPPLPERAPHDGPARSESRTALAAADSLSQLHAEITAYRRAEQVLTGPEVEGLRLRPLPGDARSECRYLGLIGEPVCGIPRPARMTCAGGTRCSRAEPLRLSPKAERIPQPSRPAPDLTRV